MSDAWVHILLVAAVTLGGAGLAGLVVSWLAWRRAGRDVPFGAYYAATHRFFMFNQPMRQGMDWETTRIAGRRDVILCQRIILAISVAALLAFLTIAPR
ncbi:hypothetical protein [Roseomonas fluvialis]|uniref:Uncharacterized protein n=1 Tax=Roseomonas fluvialis TaxID=1750527 RepID=A0ABM7Y307_9PROT|nr:hypothetical protein [Roseomonas fluvialis]BDG72194.1 hypothetical protein Rmf_21230 [Roseomonas fluvialis]